MSKLSNLSKGAQETAMGNTLMSKCIAVFVALSLVLFQVPVTSAFAEDADQSGTPAVEQSQGSDDSTATQDNDQASESQAAADDEAAEADEGADASATDEQVAPASQNGESAAAGSDATETDQEASAPAKKSARAKAKSSGKVTVTTADELKEAAANADVTEIVLGSHIVIDQAITIDRAVTISGSTLSRSDRTKSVFVVTASGDLTLKNIALADNGKDGNASKYASAIVNSGKLSLNDGAVISGFKAADGGAVYAKSGSTVEINGATLSNNMACGTGHAAMGGAIYGESSSSITMTSGTIDGNTACSANNPDNRNGGMGGGICLARNASMTMEGGTISNNVAGYETDDKWVTARNGAGGGVFVNTGAGFVMNNGTVSGNKALSGTSGINYYGGGGICIWNSGGYDFSGKAQVNAGAITGNEATLVGGGLYVHNYRLVPMHNAAVVGNAATIHGGGLYLCMVGEVYNFATDGTIFTNNAAAGNDGDYAPGDDLWSDEPWGGSKANFHLPERTESGEAITWYEDTRSNPYSETSEPIEDFTTWFESAKNGNIGLRCDAPYSADDYALIVSGNKAQEGGGIGCNGILEMCNPEEDDVPLTVKKVWDGIGEGSQVEVTINVFNGTKKIDTVKLNADNNWEAKLTGLPADGEYSVTEEAVEGCVATVKKTSETEWEFTVTNKPDKKPVDFAKTDIAGNEIAGAKLAILDEEGNAVLDAEGNAVAWTSEAGKIKTINLKPGTYTLTETTAPTGYQVAQNITFTLASDGKVTVKDADGNDVEAELITMTDAYAEAFVDKDFTKYLYANNMDQTFSFTMAECDAQGNVLDDVSNAASYERNDLAKTTVSADDPITVTVKNSKDYTDYAAAIDFPQLRYTKAGTHYYRVSEDSAAASSHVVTDDSWFLLCVEVTENVSTGALSAQVVSQNQYYDGEAYEVADDELAFYNNETMTMSCMSMDYGFASFEGQELVVGPSVSKELNGRVLTEGEFTFKMTETTDGSSHNATYATNDAQGNVMFDLLSFTQPGTYTYEITEVAGQDATVAYSDQVITLTVNVSYDENGALKGKPVYSENGTKVDVPTFVNTATKPIVRVQKTSKDGSGDPLAGARYGLWMKNAGGADVYLGSELSDKDGYVTFANVDIKVGESYYFKEVSAPTGHTVDEYASPLFKVVQMANGYELKYEGDEGFDTAADEPATIDVNALSVSIAGYDDNDDAKATADTAKPAKTTVLTYEKDGKGVQDEVVKLEVSKFDKATHEYVEGAEFKIIEKATGKTVATWKSGTDAKMLERQLNVDTTYILREAKAPEGYAAAADTEFTIGEYGDLSIIKGDDAKSTGKYSLEVYDTRLPVEKTVTNEVVDKTKRTENPPATTITQYIGKTGDNAPLAALIAILACAGVAVIAAAVNRRRQH